MRSTNNKYPEKIYFPATATATATATKNIEYAKK